MEENFKTVRTLHRLLLSMSAVVAILGLMALKHKPYDQAIDEITALSQARPDRLLTYAHKHVSERYGPVLLSGVKKIVDENIQQDASSDFTLLFKGNLNQPDVESLVNFLETAVISIPMLEDIDGWKAHAPPVIKKKELPYRGEIRYASLLHKSEVPSKRILNTLDNPDYNYRGAGNYILRASFGQKENMLLGTGTPNAAMHSEIGLQSFSLLEAIAAYKGEDPPLLLQKLIKNKNLNLQGIVPFWDEINNKTVVGAELYLTSAKSASPTTISFLGVQFPLFAFELFIPILFIGLLVYLYLHINFIRIHYVSEHSSFTFPWLPIFPGRFNWLVSIVSICGLPLGSFLFFAYETNIKTKSIVYLVGNFSAAMLMLILTIAILLEISKLEIRFQVAILEDTNDQLKKDGPDNVS